MLNIILLGGVQLVDPTESFFVLPPMMIQIFHTWFLMDLVTHVNHKRNVYR